MKKIFILLFCFLPVCGAYAQDAGNTQKSKKTPRSKDTGIGILTDETPSHSASEIYYEYDAYRVTDISFRKDTVLIRKRDYYDYDARFFCLFYNSSSGFERMAALPKTQNGITTKPDRELFRTGTLLQNNLTFEVPFNPKKRKQSYSYLLPYIEANIGQFLRNSPIRNSDMKSYNFSLATNFSLLENLSMRTSAAYSNAHGNLLNQGSNLSSIIGSIFMPADSEHSNEWNHRNALSDKEKGEQLLLALNTRYCKELKKIYSKYDESKGRVRYTQDFASDLNANFQYISQNRIFGIPKDFFGLEDESLSHIKNRGKFGQVAWNNTYTIWKDSYPSYMNFQFTGDYILDIDQKELNFQHNVGRWQGDFQRLRIAHELNYDVRMVRRYSSRGDDFYYTIHLFSRHYFSNTVTDYVNWFPSAELLFSYRPRGHRLNLIFTTGRSMNEAPLIYTDPAVLSVLLPSSVFYRYFETQGLYASQKLKPETKGEYNINLSYYCEVGKYHILLFAASWSYATNRNMVLPIYQDNRFQLQNSVSVINSDWNANVGYFFEKDDFSLSLRAKWSKGWNKVKSTRDNAYIPVAGFSNISTGMLADNPACAIYGTTWLRDENGNKIVDNDGFPLVNNTLSMIGNPTPDWILHFIPSFTWKKIGFSFVLDAQKGGDKWNGTAAALNYFENSNLERYGMGGVGEEYIVDASSLRFSEINLSYQIPVKNRIIENFTIGFSVHNILLYTKYAGVEPLSTLYNSPSGAGLDMFNIPGVRSYMLNIQLVLKK